MEIRIGDTLETTSGKFKGRVTALWEGEDAGLPVYMDCTYSKFGYKVGGSYGFKTTELKRPVEVDN
jgi:TPP-dependent trihydroxycyclohexane-1,2-dione (THcHDO) dehydratase